ncbi:MAG: hypothetical protein ACK528_09885 [Alphaproteobacteria bacterium]
MLVDPMPGTAPSVIASKRKPAGNIRPERTGDWRWNSPTRTLAAIEPRE